MSLQAGRLRHRVQLQRRVTGFDPVTGDPIDTWEAYAEPWAEVRGLAGRTFFMAQQTVAASTHQIRMRWRGDVQPGHRVLHAGRAYSVDAALDPTGRREELVVLAKEVAPA